MRGHVRVANIDLGVVETGLGDPGFEIVRYHRRGHAAEEGKGANMRADPVGQALCPGRL